MDKFRANGKLLLSGEYFVLDGALSLGLPTRLGQRMTVEEYSSNEKTLHWQSFDKDNSCWFEVIYNLSNLEIQSTSNDEAAILLQKMLTFIVQKNALLLQTGKAFRVKTYLEFPRNWGLGSSSTLVVLLGKWANINPFEILFNSMKGSGYDIACGMTDSALTYQLDGKTPKVKEIDFNPSFKSNIYFVHLNQKQNSREGIARFREKTKLGITPLNEITALTKQFIKAKTLKQFNDLISQHETLVAQTIELPRAKDLYFQDYSFGEIKSLGAWGGDFIMITSTTSKNETIDYFNKKGFETILTWDEMIL